MHILNVDALPVCIEFQDELLQVEEGPLVPSMLPDLYVKTPLRTLKTSQRRI